jgi:phenylalanyl-tRNA synthetase beta chain
MKNPLTEDASVMRTTIIPGVLESVRSNVNAGNKNLKIFETGKVYFPAPGSPLPDEKRFVCAAVTGLSSAVNWKGTPAEIDFFDLKGVVEILVEALGADGVRTAKSASVGFHPGMCADVVVGGKTVGKMGEVHPAVLDKYEIGQKVFVFEIDLDEIEAGPKAEGGYEKFSRFPHADRDLAVVVDERVEAAAVNEAILGAGGEILRDVTLFDVYTGKQIDGGKKSLAFGLRFQSRERTLTDEEITAASDNIMKALEDKFDARLRA